MSQEAQSRTQEAKKAIEELENTLKHAIETDDTDTWETLKDTSPFSELKPNAPSPTYIHLPPNEKDYQPKIGLLDKMSSSRMETKINDAKNRFKFDMKIWEEKKAATLKTDEECLANYKRRLKLWEESRNDFLSKQQKTNEIIDKRKENYHNGNPDAVIDYCEVVLSYSQYPDYFPKEFDLDYNPETKILIVDYALPAIDDIPRIKEVKYVKSKDELVEVYQSESALNKLYDDLIYQITLRNI
jgi:restriction system protein